ncbi:MAG TPA: hypothetical protein VML55_19405, partial [Planctomycetaceae bacterium]|nr:hypothetical protein [Planctomycetaceae bacterium]
TWDRDSVARQINEFCEAAAPDVSAAVSALANVLGDCITSAKRGRQISAASKIAFFSKPGRDVYIWDRLAKKSAAFRNCRSAAFADYAAYSAACSKALDEECRREDFTAAVKKFRAYLQKVGGPMAADSVIHESSYIERRLLDKLLFWEGKWLEK